MSSNSQRQLKVMHYCNFQSLYLLKNIYTNEFHLHYTAVFLKIKLLSAKLHLELESRLLGQWCEHVYKTNDSHIGTDQ